MKLSRAPTLGRLLDRDGGVLRGLASFKVILVVTILAWQSAEVTASYGFITGSKLWPIGALASTALFALIGFTLQSARTRSEPVDFLSRRGRRLGPPLLVSTVLTLVVIGPLATVNGVTNYFRDPESWAYLLNLIAVPRLTLPGVFEFNSLPDVVNAYLWSVPALAIVILALAVTPPLGRRGLWVLAATAAAIALAALAADIAGALSAADTDPLGLLLAGPGLSGILAGLTGAMLYRLRGMIRADRRAATALALSLAAIAIVGDANWLRSSVFHIAIAGPTGGLALYAATWRLPWPRAAARIGRQLTTILLCAFPIQQLLAMSGPAGSNGLINLAVTLPVTAAIAFISWRLIERRALEADQREMPGMPPPAERGTTRVALVAALRPITLAAVVTLIALAAMALTFYALQRPPDGM